MTERLKELADRILLRPGNIHDNVSMSELHEVATGLLSHIADHKDVYHLKRELKAAWDAYNRMKDDRDICLKERNSFQDQLLSAGLKPRIVDRLVEIVESQVASQLRQHANIPVRIAIKQMLEAEGIKVP